MIDMSTISDEFQRLDAEVRKYVAKLGTTPDEIRTTLVDLGFKGQIRASDDCPVVRYLHDALDTRVRVTTVDGIAMIRVIAMDQVGVEVCLGGTSTAANPLASFIDRFDGGFYPELNDSLTAAQMVIIDAIMANHTP